MKTVFKIITGIVLSLLVLVVLIISILFSTDSLTSLVRKYADNYVSCSYRIGGIEPTFWSTFPQFGIEIQEIALFEENDTLLSLSSLKANIDMNRLWKQQEIVLNEFRLDGLCLHLQTQSDGRNNYDVFPASDTTENTSDSSLFAFPFKGISLHNVTLENCCISYDNKKDSIYFFICNLNSNIELQYQGDEVEGLFNLSSPDVSVEMGKNAYLQHHPLSLTLPFSLSTNNWHISLQKAALVLNEISFLLDGTLQWDEHTQDVDMALDYRLERQDLASYLALIPPSYTSYLEGYSLSGEMAATGRIEGLYTQEQWPDVSAEIDLYQLFWKERNTTISGKINAQQLLNDKMAAETALRIDTRLQEWQSFMPQEMDLSMSGKLQAQVNARGRLVDVENRQWERLQLSTQLNLSDWTVHYDSIDAMSEQTQLHLDFPGKNALVDAHIDQCPALGLRMGKDISLNINKLDAAIDLSNFLNNNDSTALPDMYAQLKMRHLHFIGPNQTTLSLNHPNILLSFGSQSNAPQQIECILDYQSKDIHVEMPDNKITAERLVLSAELKQNSAKEDLLLRWNPVVSVYLQQAQIETASFKGRIDLPEIQFDYNNQQFIVYESNVRLGNSDFHLSGEVKNMDEFIDKTGLLTAELTFESNQTDVNELLSLTSGLGIEDSTIASTTTSAIDSLQPLTDNVKTANPFIVPKGVDLCLHTNIKKAAVGNQDVRNLKGNLYIKDGIMVLEEMGFICQAARLQLTAMYRSPRPNHLYVGLDYHMMDIQIEELVQMVPNIDSVLPMLRSFRGKGEFHLAAETYLTADYRLKKSTLRGASSLRGENLVLLDGETFSEIAKVLMFNKKTENKIDSISAELTMFKNEVDVYPFVISMDKYKAIVGGRHHLDMTFNYHISLVESPFPKMGVDISGNIGDIKIKPVPCKYTDEFKPAKRYLVSNQQMALRKTIRESLLKSVKE